MRRYELMLLLRPDLEDDKLQSAVERVTRAIVNAGGSLSKVSPWGKRRLAYRIQNFREASYFLIHFDIEPAQVRGIERGLLISEEILRHLVTLIEDRGPSRDEDEELPPAAVAGPLEAPDIEIPEDDLVEPVSDDLEVDEEDEVEEAQETADEAERVEENARV
jgi:small subunit ribosomal protein S6